MAPQRIVGAHLHLYDPSVNHHAFLETADATFQSLVGDYSALPEEFKRRYRR